MCKRDVHCVGVGRLLYAVCMIKRSFISYGELFYPPDDPYSSHLKYFRLACYDRMPQQQSPKTLIFASCFRLKSIYLCFCGSMLPTRFKSVMITPPYALISASPTWLFDKPLLRIFCNDEHLPSHFNPTAISIVLTHLTLDSGISSEPSTSFPSLTTMSSIAPTLPVLTTTPQSSCSPNQTPS